MKFKGLDLNLVVALNALLSEKSVSGAGRKVALSQPAMSGALARLREHFRDELLVPHGRGMALTSFAVSLIDPVRRLMIEIEATLGAGAAFDPASSRRAFRINVTDFVTEVIMVPLVAKVAEAAPGVMIEFVRPPAISQALEEGFVDIIIGPEGSLSRRHDMELLIEDPYRVVGDAENPYLHHALTVKRFFDLGHVSIRYGRNNEPTFAELQVMRQPHRRKVEVRTSTFSAVPLLVVGTRRIALLNASLAHGYAKRFPIICVDPPFEISPLSIYAQHHEAAKVDGGVQWLRGLIQEAVRGGGPIRPANGCHPNKPFLPADIRG